MKRMQTTWTGAARRIPGALAAVAVLAGCAEDDTGREPLGAGEYGEWDSAGVRIVESPREALVTSLPFEVDTVPDLELGEVDSTGPTAFESISGIVGLPDGGLVVLDAGSGGLRWFDASGEHVGTSGGRGQGPGEFLDPVVLPQFQSDSLLVFDRGRRAFTWVALDGSGERTLRPAGQLLVGSPRMATSAGAAFRSTPSSGPCVENEPCETSRLLRWIDPTGSVADTLAVYPRRMMSFRERPGLPSVRLGGPFDQEGLAAVGPDGPVIEGSPRFELKQFDPEGGLIAIFRVDGPAREASQDALDQYLQGFSDPDRFERVYELMGLPDYLPAFQALHVDPLGFYWAELFRPGEAGASEWLVFDRDGRARGIVELPRELEVHEIGEDYVLGLWTDELDVEYVRRHALDRR